MHHVLLSFVVTLSAVSLVGCDDPADPPRTRAAQAETVPPAPEQAPAEEPLVADPNEACAEVIVVSYAGAEYAADTVTRDESAAREKAEGLRARLDEGTDFAELARVESDAASTGPRGGLMGTYTRDEWPAPHMAIREALFGLSVGQISDVVAAPYGYVVMRRCAVEKVHTRHILVRYEGAKNAPESITRTKEEALALAAEIRTALTADGADFAAVATERSEDGSAERGGDMGELGRGRLSAPYEAAAFALAVGGMSEPVESEFGYHIIERLP